MAAQKRSTSPAWKAKTLIYVHGIANKPPENVLKNQWDRALFGFDLGERSRMAYWVNRDRHGPPLGDTRDPDEIAALAPKPGFSPQSVVHGKALASLIPPEAKGAARESMLRLMAEIGPEIPPAPGGFGAKVLPLPRFLRGWITRGVTGAFLEDVHDLFFVPAQRAKMRQSLISRLTTGGGPFVIIAHSQGSIIAQDVLSTWDTARHGALDLPLLITIGSPLGVQEVQDQLRRLNGRNALHVPSMVKRWLNFADDDDVVALDEKISNDFTPKRFITDHEVENPVRENPHSGIGYLSLEAVRKEVADAIQKSLFQKVSEFTVAKDLVRGLGTTGDDVRHQVLIELQDRQPAPHEWKLKDGGKPDKFPDDAITLDESRDRVVQWIMKRCGASPDLKAALRPPGRKKSPVSLAQAIDLEALHAYVSARLTRPEVEELAATLRGVAVFRVFKNGVKSRHLQSSVEAIQARTSHIGYAAMGQGITWAVLDTGIDAGHPHFRDYQNIERIYDCMAPGPLSKAKAGSNNDGDGHGTHVAGIIAGGYDGNTKPAFDIRGTAPKAKLWCYKVLGDNGDGSDAKIIKALDHIYSENRKAPAMRVHGVNLSLGGTFDPESFGCGDTPLCKELRKLWRQGVLIVISAGNEGQFDVPGMPSLNTYISIGDPANLDESIVVGSVHPTKPHLYGVSYFSSRGPTADGRSKPDVVAPGEKILSCRSRTRGAARGKELDDLYIRMSGTSMAAPHVSGLLACFLSARREFIGYPDRVKQILMNSCTDLERDIRHQGKGLVNLVKMLIHT